MDQAVKAEHEREQKADSPFIFRGGALALDFVNTEIMVRGKRRDLLVTPQDVGSWWQAVQHEYLLEDEVRSEEREGDEKDDSALLDILKTVRASLRAIFSALIAGVVPSQTDVKLLNAMLKMGNPSLEWMRDGKPSFFYRTTDGKQGVMLLSLALSALHVIREGELKRLHHCENERCILLFYDSTKSATRRWCSLSCLERTRSSQRYRARKGQNA